MINWQNLKNNNICSLTFDAFTSKQILWYGPYDLVYILGMLRLIMAPSVLKKQQLKYNRKVQAAGIWNRVFVQCFC